MTNNYNEIEDSAAGAAPIELFKFQAPDRSYHYTSDFTEHLVAGVRYDPLTLSRAAIVESNSGDSARLEVTVPFNSRIAQDFALTYAPPENLRVIVYRMHEEDAGTLVVYWDGDVTSVVIKGRTARFVSPSNLASAVVTNLPGKTYQLPCNHLLYSRRCGVNRRDFESRHEVQAITSNVISLSSQIQEAGDYYVGGELVSLSGGERRMIVETGDSSVTVSYPFRLLRVGDEITIAAGCSHSVEACRDKYNNVKNFGGFPFIPTVNAFKTGMQ